MKRRGWLGLGLLGALAYLGVPYALVQVGNLGVLRRGRGPGSGVALTFDDGPDPATTPAVLDALGDAGVKGTFFMLGERAARHPQLARRVRDEGHEVASHGFSHVHGWRRPPWTARADLRRSLDTLRAVTGEDARYFRPPHGAYSLATLLALRGAPVRAAHWTVETHDWSGAYRPQDVVKRVLAHVEAGGVIVMHDAGPGGPTAAAALPDLIRELRARGYTPGPLGALDDLRPEQPRDLLPRALRLLDRAFDRRAQVVRFGVNANSLLRAGLTRFPVPDHPRYAQGAPLLELHVNSERMTQFMPRPLTGIRHTRESLRELARALPTLPQWEQAQGVFAIGPFSDILGALGFEVNDAPPQMQRRLGLWSNLLRRVYGSAGGQAHDVRIATISREELLRRYG